MSRKTEMLILIVATVVIAFLSVRSITTIGLWRVASLCYLAGLSSIIIGWMSFFNNKDEY